MELLHRALRGTVGEDDARSQIINQVLQLEVPNESHICNFSLMSVSVSVVSVFVSAGSFGVSKLSPLGCRSLLSHVSVLSLLSVLFLWSFGVSCLSWRSRAHVIICAISVVCLCCLYLL